MNADDCDGIFRSPLLGWLVSLWIFERIFPSFVSSASQSPSCCWLTNDQFVRIWMVRSNVTSHKLEASNLCSCFTRCLFVATLSFLLRNAIFLSRQDPQRYL